MSNRTPAGDKGTADRIEADDGGYWVRLVTKQALDREGACMQHCVGDGSYDDLVGGEELNDDSIWSLRDRDGLSVLTVRIRNDELNYAKGYSNHSPGKGAAMQVRHLVAAFKAGGYVLEVSECETEIVLLEDGRTFRRDRLPPEVQAEIQERDARRRERRFPTVWNMRNARIEGGHLVVERHGITHQLIEVASHFADSPEPVADGPVDGFDLNDTVVTIRFPEGRRIHVPVSGDTRLVSRGEDYQPLPSSLYEIGPATVLARPANSPRGTSFMEIAGFGSDYSRDPAFMLTHDFPDPIVRMCQRPDGRGHSYLTRSGIQFDIRLGALPATGPAQARNEEFLRIYRAAIDRAARARPPEEAAHAAPARSIETVTIDGGTILARLSDGETVPLAHVMGTPEGTTVTCHDNMGDTLLVGLSNGDFHHVPHPAPQPMHRVTIGGPQGWQTVLGEQAAEFVSYGSAGGGSSGGYPGGGGGGRPVPTVAIGVDTQPQARPSFVMITTRRMKDTLFNHLTRSGARP